MIIIRKLTNIIIFYFFIILLLSNVVQAQEINDVSAKAILEQINNGTDIYYDNSNIIGNLFIGGPEYGSYYTEGNNSARIYFPLNTSVIESRIVIMNSNFENNFIVTNIEFKNYLFFGNTDFSGIFYFRDVNFNGSVNFLGGDFENSVYLENINFSKDANFEYANFNSAVFRKIIFNEESNFNFTTFNDLADFKDIIFHNNSYFNSGCFKGDTGFYNVTFNGQVSFFGAEFIGNHPIQITYFNETKFIGDADFKFSSFNGRTYFWDSTFYKNADFSLTNFESLTFVNTTFTSVDFYESYFKIMRVEWKSIRNALTFDGPTYLRLIKNFREVEQFTDADTVYYEYWELKRKNEGGLWNYLSWITCGYGVRPFRTLVLGLFLMLVLFPIIYWIIGMSLSNAFEYSCITFINGYNPNFSSDELTSIIQRMKKYIRIPNWKYEYYKNLKKLLNHDFIVNFYLIFKKLFNPKKVVKYLMISETLLGWLILALFLVTLANVMIRP